VNIEHLVEPKLKDLEDKIRKLEHLLVINNTIDDMERDWGPAYGPPVKIHRSGSMIVDKRHGPYLINYQIQKL
jgi:hypothetical protein